MSELLLRIMRLPDFIKLEASQGGATAGREPAATPITDVNGFHIVMGNLRVPIAEL